jgi:hypothetical protein
LFIFIIQEKIRQVAKFHRQENNVCDNLFADICNASQGQKG